VARQVWRAFCRHGTIFIWCRRDRGTRLIDDRDIVLVDEVAKGYWRSVAMQVVYEAENCHSAGVLLRAAVRILVQG